MRIQHNITALNAHRQLGINNTSVGKNLEKLSSGFRINRAGDDAAGLAISEKMRGQIRGLDMASNNAQDGISLIQTAEGNLQETHSILQRMRELAVQSSNGTFENTNDRENLDKEVQALKAEVNRIASSAHFNNAKLLNGDLKSELVTPAGELAAASKIEMTSTDGKAGSDAVAAVYETDIAGLKAGLNGDTLEVFGVSIDIVAAGVAGTSLTAGATFTSDADIKLLTDILNEKSPGFKFEAAAGSTKITATATTGGAVASSKDADMKKSTTVAGAGVANAVNATNATVSNASVGTDAGAGAAAKKATYDIELDFANLAGGQTIKVGDKTFTFVTDEASSAADGKINVSKSTTNAEKDQIRTDLAAAFNHANGFGTAGAQKATAVASSTAGDGKITVTADAAGSGSNLGAFRMSSNFATIAQKTFGSDTGTPNSTIFATATIDMDFSKFAVGDKFTINGKTFEAIAAGGTADISKNQFALGTTEQASGDSFVAALEAEGSFKVGKAAYSATDNKLTITATDAALTSEAFVAALKVPGDVKFIPKGGDPADAVTKGGVVFQIGANGTQDDRVSLTIEAQDAKTLGIAGIDIKTITGANAAIDLITDATNKVSGTRADLGALQNRLEHTVANLGTTSENLTAAESRIRDVDMAKEMMEMTKNNILSQAAQAMLAQANQQPQGILQLLR